MLSGVRTTCDCVFLVDALTRCAPSLAQTWTFGVERRLTSSHFFGVIASVLPSSVRSL